MIWVEKYAPQILDDIIGNKDEVKKLKLFIKSNFLTNLLLSGEPGTGKTSTLLCLAKEYFGQNYDENVLELNASDDRGIETVRNKIKTFCSRKTIKDKYKIVILDEADNMTINAQYSLRKTMDYFENKCVFFFTSNHLPSIIEPIQDRCTIFNFGKIEEEEINNKLKEIAIKEGVKIDNKALSQLKYYTSHECDLRSMINIFEFISMETKKKITTKILESIFEKPPHIIIKKLVEELFNKNLKNVIEITKGLLERGCSVYDIFDRIFYFTKNDYNCDESEKLLFFEVLAPYHTSNINGFQTLTQLMAFFITYARI